MYLYKFALGGIMEIFASLLGNEKIKNSLGCAIRDSKFLHAYIIEGAKGTGKRTIARLSAAAIMCRSRESLPCGKCDTCRKILNDNCVDVKMTDTYKADDVRDVKEKLYESPTECDYKIYIFNDAQKMTVKAQNSLLLALEEPPVNVVFFLLCTDAGALLETIRSRAQILHTEPLDSDTIFGYIKKNGLAPGISDDRLKEIILCSGGSLGYVIDMANPQDAKNLAEKRERALRFVKSILSPNADGYSFIYSLQALSREDISEMLSDALSLIRDMTVTKKDKSARLCFFTTYENAFDTASPYDIKKLLACYENVERALYDIASNASVINTLALIMAEKKGK